MSNTAISEKIGWTVFTIGAIYISGFLRVNGEKQ